MITKSFMALWYSSQETSTAISGRSNPVDQHTTFTRAPHQKSGDFIFSQKLSLCVVSSGMSKCITEMVDMIMVLMQEYMISIVLRWELLRWKPTGAVVDCDFIERILFTVTETTRIIDRMLTQSSFILRGHQLARDTRSEVIPSARLSYLKERRM